VILSGKHHVIVAAHTTEPKTENDGPDKGREIGHVPFLVIVVFDTVYHVGLAAETAAGYSTPRVGDIAYLIPQCIGIALPSSIVPLSPYYVSVTTDSMTRAIISR
jgi:hypothetical protein